MTTSLESVDDKARVVYITAAGREKGEDPYYTHLYKVGLDGTVDFDVKKKYPVIAYVYPGPQTGSVTKTFNPRNNDISLAQFGFVVIEVGNRGAGYVNWLRGDYFSRYLLGTWSESVDILELNREEQKTGKTSQR